VFLGGVLSLLSPVHGFFGTLFPDYDVLFNVDTSGSIYELGTSPYAPLELMDFQKLYIRDLAIGMQSVNARMGFFLYAKDVNKSRNIQFWGNVDEVTTFVDGLTWTGGLGDACGAIEASLQEFESLSLAGVGRPQLLMLFADDQPRTHSQYDGNCPETICDYATALQDQDFMCGQSRECSRCGLRAQKGELVVGGAWDDDGVHRFGRGVRGVCGRVGHCVLRVQKGSCVCRGGCVG